MTCAVLQNQDVQLVQHFMVNEALFVLVTVRDDDFYND